MYYIINNYNLIAKIFSLILPKFKKIVISITIITINLGITSQNNCTKY